MAILNFPREYYAQLMRGSSSSPSPSPYLNPYPSSGNVHKSFDKGSSSSGGQEKQVFEFEYLDDKVLEELLETEDEKIKKKMMRD
ncbi:hypothetical protein Gogos_003459 [Gossypium gossypioides]|uniref:Uncharacterized protein n=1 Tax=Gossypium gossypioides TaxID=34282 RepID=A0A7J9CM05_GOSGO|nr:hypothetical protein [Gossypium gossypioides]